MDLHELATNAELNHWPPHLGVRTDAEKIAYLAGRLREAGDAEVRVDELSDQLVAAQEENASLETKNDDLQSQITSLKGVIKELQSRLTDIREIAAE
jgi:peptidoglycan hydrolase CwlO-like protein